MVLFFTMVQPGEVDPQLKPIGSVADVAEAAGALASQFATFARGFQQDSAAAIEAVNPELSKSNTEIGNEWPLTCSFENLCRLTAEIAINGVMRDATNPVNAQLESGKYHAPLLADAYPDADSPHLAFAADMVQWANVMREKDHPLLVVLYLGEDENSAIKYTIFEDSEVTRGYLNDRTDIENTEEGFEPYRWVGTNSIAYGTAEQIDALRAAVL